MKDKMIRLIDGILFDTSKAKKIADGSNKNGTFEDYEESLYEMKAPNNPDYEFFFLAGSGGPKSKYAITENNITTGSSAIIVLGSTYDGEYDQCRDNVLAWIGKHFVDDELMKALKKTGFLWQGKL